MSLTMRPGLASGMAEAYGERTASGRATQPASGSAAAAAVDLAGTCVGRCRPRFPPHWVCVSAAEGGSGHDAVSSSVRLISQIGDIDPPEARTLDLARTVSSSHALERARLVGAIAAVALQAQSRSSRRRSRRRSGRVQPGPRRRHRCRSPGRAGDESHRRRFRRSRKTATRRPCSRSSSCRPTASRRPATTLARDPIAGACRGGGGARRRARVRDFLGRVPHRPLRQRDSRPPGADQTFVTTAFGPMDLVALMDPLLPVDALRFTRDRTELADKIRKLEGRLRHLRADAQRHRGGAVAAPRRGARPRRGDGVRTQVRGGPPRGASRKDASRSSSSAKACSRSASTSSTSSRS